MQALRRAAAAAALGVAALAAAAPAGAQDGDAIVLDARKAWAARDQPRLAALRDRALAESHPLAPWLDYWALNVRLAAASADELEAFYRRWSGSYVEDRLRNDWLLELGQRRDWAAFRADYLRFRMDDDREARCYWLLTESLEGQPVRAAALDAWLAQQRDDDGCALMATALAGSGVLSRQDLWLGVRHALQANRPAAARRAAALVDADAERALAAVLDNPARWLARQRDVPVRADRAELALAALLRIAREDPELAAAQLGAWERRLPPEHAAQAWAHAGHRGALRQLPQAADWYARAWALLPPDGPNPGWLPETLEWSARAALRGHGDPSSRWRLLRRTVEGMPAGQRAEPAWVYWHARATRALAPRGAAGDAERAAADEALASIAGGMHFYGKLAAETLGRALAPPPAPPPLQAAERDAVRALPGLQRALQLIAIGLRSEGVREWNFSLRDLPAALPRDRALRAAAEMACEREVWDRCINTSDRTSAEVDLAQRYPMPLRDPVLRAARDAGLDPAYVYGLVRQESRFVMNARSHVGASGLMQLMPETARWTARRLGLDFKPSMIDDRDVNLRLGTGYLKLVLEDFEGRIVLAAAAYNAGPSRSRRWREGTELEAAAWIETIPFNETRDYVQKVVSNAVYYGLRLGDGTASLQRRLGGPVGPRQAAAPPENKELP